VFLFDAVNIDVGLGFGLVHNNKVQPGFEDFLID